MPFVLSVNQYLSPQITEKQMKQRLEKYCMVGRAVMVGTAGAKQCRCCLLAILSSRLFTLATPHCQRVITLECCLQCLDRYNRDKNQARNTLKMAIHRYFFIY